jgi:hypothetical protein
MLGFAKFVTLWVALVAVTCVIYWIAFGDPVEGILIGTLAAAVKSLIAMGHHKTWAALESRLGHVPQMAVRQPEADVLEQAAEPD